MISAEQGAFRALADPTRRQILMHLSTREMTIAQVCENFEVTRGAIKKHLVILEEGNLISVQRSGRERINRLHPQGMKSAVDWLQYFNRFWDDKLSSLENAINSENKSKENNND